MIYQPAESRQTVTGATSSL